MRALYDISGCIYGKDNELMKLVIGGKCQGKLNYVTSTFQINPEQVSDGKLGDTEIIYNFQNVVRDILDNEYNAEKGDSAYEITYQKVQIYVKKHPECIIICNEVGAGLVPMEKFEREYRDTVGKICCELAKEAKSVHRVVCGIGMVIKND